MLRQIILDTETTGLNVKGGDRLIEIGCIELINRKVTGNRFHHYINPECDISKEAVAIHGITKAFLADKPIFATIVEEFMQFVKGAELIIHNAPFDTAFINHELKSVNASWKTIQKYCLIVDTLVLAKKLHPGQRNSLDALCKRYKIDNSHREFHGALLDAHLLSQVYLAMTGGQGSLFDEVAIIPEENEEKIKLEWEAKIARKKLPVLLANADEMQSHEKKLQDMGKQGKCLWGEAYFTACNLNSLS